MRRAVVRGQWSGVSKKKLFAMFFISLFTIHCSLFTAYASDDFRKRKPQTEESVGTEDDIKAEVLFGRELAARILGKYSLYREESLSRYLNMVGKGMAQYTNRPEIEFRFAVLDTNMVNAFAAPGGYIFVTKGALAAMEDEAELAGVLAHELAHVNERHIVKELNIKATDDSSAVSLARILSGGTDTMKAAFLQMVDKAVEILFEKGLKKQDELDSDTIATMTLASAGYDPSALSRYLSKISVSEKEVRVLSGTHPSFEERIKGIESVLAENRSTDSKPAVVKERFNENVRIK